MKQEQPTQNPEPNLSSDKSSDKSAGLEPGPGLDPTKTPGFFQVTMSVLAAALGVQTNANRERDFSQSSPLPYIVGGIIFTITFVLCLIGVVILVLPN